MVTAFLSPSRSLRVALPAVLALCVIAMWGGRAEGSCGDWLEGHAAFEAAMAPVVVTTGSIDAESLPLPGRRPCHGPSCGRVPHVPSAPSDAPTNTLDLERDAMLAAATVDQSPSSRRAVVTEPASLPSAFPGRLDRPPRGV